MARSPPPINKTRFKARNLYTCGEISAGHPSTDSCVCRPLAPNSRDRGVPRREGSRTMSMRGRLAKASASPSRWRWPASSQSILPERRRRRASPPLPGDERGSGRRSRGADVRQRSLPERLLRHADFITGEVWVESDFDSDLDGKKDRLHADFTLPRETRDGRPEGPGRLRGQPVLRGHRRRAQLARRPRARRPSPARAGVLQRHATRARTSPTPTRRPGCRAASPSCTPSPRARAQRRLPDVRRPERDARRHGDHRLAQRPQEGLHEPRRHARPRPSRGTTARRR